MKKDHEDLKYPKEKNENGDYIVKRKRGKELRNLGGDIKVEEISGKCGYADGGGGNTVRAK